MSGAFNDIAEIIQKRVSSQGIGFGATLPKADEKADLLKHIKSEDLIQYGFESEFVGRLPVRAIFEHLNETDLYHILKNPNNPITLGKKLDFAAYGIDAKFEDKALQSLARKAAKENTGARGSRERRGECPAALRKTASLYQLAQLSHNRGLGGFARGRLPAHDKRTG